MRHASLLRFLSIAILDIVFAISGLFGSEAEAQGGIRLRQPFAGTYRLTAYVDHRSPDYTYDGNVVVYNGEERLDCPDCGEVWTDQGPYCYDGHNATDYALPGNTPVLAAASGRVTFRGWRSTYYGNSIRIDHGNGYETWYSHLAGFSVNLNDTVAAGQQIGLSGNTGQNQPYHLHFEVRHNGNVTDPFGWREDWSDPLSGGTAVCLWGDDQCFEVVVEDESD